MNQYTIFLKIKPKDSEEHKWQRVDFEMDKSLDGAKIDDMRIFKTDMLPAGEIPEFIDFAGVGSPTSHSC